ncbi:MAG: tRNA (5-methylaminomethyl-2-thiouridine)(34)-methyltransferase MnmD [Alphaproteobacteria bacterium]|nr:tRNA (5-methylaminomethyl-2-thiouridine)(34)-methyltransferase MnmD [Alphaproteobacteria bacterium]
MVLRSERFDDVYFSAEDGLAETRHVFLAGNDLPGAWVGKECFVIAETGFGTGLNFLAAWKLFEETAERGQELHFMSVEKFPLTLEDVRSALSHWAEIEPYADALMRAYRDAGGGDVRAKITDTVSLEVQIGDANEVLPAWERPVDAWFLDGFKPASNPDMWTGTVFAAVHRLTGTGGTFATFTAAGFVRRGLRDAGFEVAKVPGFGTKRDMLRGVKP